MIIICYIARYVAMFYAFIASVTNMSTKPSTDDERSKQLHHTNGKLIEP